MSVVESVFPKHVYISSWPNLLVSVIHWTHMHTCWILVKKYEKFRGLMLLYSGLEKYFQATAVPAAISGLFLPKLGTYQSCTSGCALACSTSGLVILRNVILFGWQRQSLGGIISGMAYKGLKSSLLNSVGPYSRVASSWLHNLSSSLSQRALSLPRLTPVEHLQCLLWNPLESLKHFSTDKDISGKYMHGPTAWALHTCVKVLVFPLRN